MTTAVLVVLSLATILASFMWVYIAARMATRAVFRSIDERNSNGKA